MMEPSQDRVGAPSILGEVGHLRPVLPREVPDRAFSFVFRNFPLVASLALLAAVPDGLGSYLAPTLVASLEKGGQDALSALALLLGAHAAAILPTTAVMAFVFLGISRANDQPRISGLLHYSLNRWPKLLLAHILLGVVGALILAVVRGLQADGGPFGAFAGAALLAASVYWAIRLLLAWPVLVIEGRTISASIRRSLRLTAAFFRPGLAAPPMSRYLLMLALPYVGLAMSTQGLALLLPAESVSGLLPVFTVFSSAFLQMLLISVLVAVYVEAITRAEAWDLELRMLRYRSYLSPGDGSPEQEAKQADAAHRPWGGDDGPGPSKNPAGPA